MTLPSKRPRRPLRLAAALATLIVLLGAAAAWVLHSGGKPRAVDGVLDLRQWSLAQDGSIPLNGQWALYWNGLPATGAEAERAKLRPLDVKVPGEWREAGLPGKGYAAYRLTVVTQGNPGTLALRIPAIAPAYRIFVDGRVIAETGFVAADRTAVRAAYKPQTATFAPPGASFEIVVQIANELYPHGGIWYSMTLGTERDMAASRLRTAIAELAVFGGCALLGLYQMALYVMRRSERSNLYFGVCCILGAVRFGAVGDMYIVQLFPHTDIRLLIALEYLTYYGGITAALLFVRELYPREYRSAVILPLAWIGGAYMAGVLLLPAETYTRLIDSYKLVSLASLAYIVFGFGKAHVRGRDGALPQLTGWLLFGGAALHDILYSNGWTAGGDVQLVPYGLILLVFIEAMELARRFTSAYRVIGTMSEQLIASNRMKDEFLANTSHELKTPLHGMLNLVQSLAEGKDDPVSDRQRERLELVVSVARRMSNLINDILDWSRLKNNAIQLERSSVDLRSVIAAQEEVFRHYIGTKPVALRLQWPERLPPVYADESRLLQIAYNLIGNAVKFTQQGEVTVSARADGEMVHLTVADTGIGIEENKLETIFQSFEQVGTSVAREYGGAGLGLGIARKLAELHGGRIAVASVPGQGSAFTVSLPIAAGKPQPYDEEREARATASLAAYRAEAAADRPGTATGQGRSGSHREPRQPLILAVDDDPVNLRVLEAVLADEPYGIVTAASGDEALQTLEREGRAIGLIILDVMMPGRTGYETCRQIRRAYPLSELPVLLTTVRGDQADVMLGFEAGANDYLTKPFEAYELRARTRTLLEMRRSAEEAVRSELAFLQAQIKPHFLYNALNTILSFSLERPQTTHDLLLHLSRYLRGSFDFRNKDRLVPLRKELELAEAYLQLEQARFGDRLRVRYEVEEGTECLLPPLTLQPLVENAVRHGITRSEDGGTVVLTVAAAAGMTIVSVEDDGPGIPESVVKQLARYSEGGAGVGLRNIRERMLRLFGTEPEIGTGSAGGAKITLRIPDAAKVGERREDDDSSDRG
ncbi:hybrid sensor histidine kinase/response regulator [Cohnella fermenti]|uniref:Circadian input-output histidine kinase CikA n=1 Tax=Cohnella fermenti TaxID=2565925 RepID=A0A4S4BK49_9BACL|nr:ATP-binding protein [Cohnella fermenti]THF74824.1 response regulator [Cohnella fermenti]